MREVASQAAGGVGGGEARDEKRKAKMKHGGSVCRREMQRSHTGISSDHVGRHDQSQKILAFCVFGAIAPGGYVLGAAWGAAIIETGLQWGWIYWRLAIVCAGLALASWAVIPEEKAPWIVSAVQSESQA